MAHILVADDEESIRTEIRRMLSSLGHTSDEAYDMVEVLAAVKKSEKNLYPYDLLILDFTFEGGASGFDIMRRLGFEYCDHRVIMLTGHQNPERPAEAANLGAIAYQLKPINQAQLNATIQTALVQREYHYDRFHELQAATEILDELLTTEKEKKELAVALEQLQYWNKALSDALQNSKNAELASLYQTIDMQAKEQLGQAEDSFGKLLLPLQSCFHFTKHFLHDAQSLLAENPLCFCNLIGSLRRLAQDATAKGRKLESVDGYFEYRIGRAHRLYFNWNEGVPNRTLQAFGHKNQQDEIIRRLRSI